jgi:hypothetical protein
MKWLDDHMSSIAAGFVMLVLVFIGFMLGCFFVKGPDAPKQEPCECRAELTECLDSLFRLADVCKKPIVTCPKPKRKMIHPIPLEP